MQAIRIVSRCDDGSCPHRRSLDGGLRTAEALRGRVHRPDPFLGDEAHAPYNRPPLSKDVLVRASSVTRRWRSRSARPTSDVKWMLGSAPQSADLARAHVTTDDGVETDDARSSSRPGCARAALPCGRSRDVHAVRTLDDAMALRSELVPAPAS